MSRTASHDDQHDPDQDDPDQDDPDQDDPDQDDGRPAEPGEASCFDLGRWLAGADAVLPQPRPAGGHRGAAATPLGRLHAISDAGLISGRAVCLTAVVPLDPVAWSWPDSADRIRPLCWICLTLTHAADDGPHALG